jgi:RNA polymerase sigma-70 factor, ECF subfamily
MAIAGPMPDSARTDTAKPMPKDDEILVDRFRGGDPSAFEELVRRHQRAIFHLARRFVRDDDEAKDLTQRAFVRAYQGVHNLRGGGAFRTWLFRIVSNLSLNHIRDHGRTKPTEDAGVDVPVEPIGADRLADAEKRAELQDAIGDLPPRQRLVLELRIFQELSFREVAQIAGCTENAAKVNFHHAVKRLRTKLSAQKGEKP